LVDEAADKTLRGIRVPPGGGDDDVEKEEEDDPFKDVPGPIANALKGLTQVVQRMDSRMDDISAELSDLSMVVRRVNASAEIVHWGISMRRRTRTDASPCAALTVSVNPSLSVSRTSTRG